ncbi:MAG: peptide chain release factor N(5)-glutamine methyltransferase [Treponema sp.]|nr:peptide chain release factor N(5)-glutamine methyltransferase [Treponema sp.]
MLIREAIAQGSADLKYAGIKTPGLDAGLLLSHVLKKDRSFLLCAGSEKLSEKNSAAFCELIEKRCSGICTAYLTGKKEFRGLEFAVNSSVLVPRPDTETLVEAALEICRDKRGAADEIKVLDLCTGSGAVAAALKHEMPELEVYASDISEEALETAKSNSARLLGENKINFFYGDLFGALEPRHSAHNAPQLKFSLIAANPPYIPSDKIETLSAEVQNEPRIALDGGQSGMEIIKRIINDAPLYLEKNGSLIMEADPDQMETIKSLLNLKGFNNIKIYNDLSGSQRVIGGYYEK